MRRTKPMRRTELQRGTSELKRTPLRRDVSLRLVSTSRQAENRQRAKAVRELRLAGDRCARCGQAGVVTDGHERRGRAQGGDPTRPDMLLCRAVCNGWCEDHPQLAAWQGWKVSRKWPTAPCIAAGYRLVMAANHWAKAIETHAANFPDAEHDCADISQVDPRRYPSTDVLWASPECTNHSQANGKRRDMSGPDLFGDTLPDEAAERSRATMYDVPRFAEAMLLRGRPYRAVVVENVVEAAKWLPFRGWLMTMDSLGYDHQLVSLNSMHAPAIAAPRAPQSRDRLYIVFHRKGQKQPNVNPCPLAWCVQCSADVAAIQAWKPGRSVGRYRAQYVYVCGQGHVVEPYALPAAAAIDWGLPGQRIGDRAKPLSPKTLARIEAGLRKYGRPMTFEARGHTFVRPASGYARAWPVDQPTATLTTTETRALVVPVEGRQAVSARPTDEPMRTQTARQQDALVVPSGGTWRESATSTREPFPAVTTRVCPKCEAEMAAESAADSPVGGVS